MTVSLKKALNPGISLAFEGEGPVAGAVAGIFDSIINTIRDAFDETKKPSVTGTGWLRWFGGSLVGHLHQLEKKITDYYANPHWLATQRFVDGTMTVKEFSPMLAVAGKFPEDIHEQLDHDAMSIQQMFQRFQKHRDEWNRGLWLTWRAVKNTGDQNILREFERTLIRLGSPIEKTGLELNEISGSFTLYKYRDTSFTNSYRISADRITRNIPAFLPALGEEGVKKYTALLLKMIEVALAIIQADHDDNLYEFDKLEHHFDYDPNPAEGQSEVDEERGLDERDIQIIVAATDRDFYRREIAQGMQVLLMHLIESMVAVEKMLHRSIV